MKDQHYDGITHGGINKNIKDTTDCVIPFNAEPGSRWDKINKFLQKELHANLKMYLDDLKNIPEFSAEQNNGVDYRMFDFQYFTEHCFMMQKYEKQKGKYTYHHDFSLENDSHRVITYLWYLTDVEEGGETEIWHSMKIKPEKGKLLLFPAHFSVPHCGLMPISSDKIIITGWLYHPNNK
jgi:Rps23 Pro-64 3,4-dihydroxylase Tpa1-like proline 4-hydroxylase